MTWLLVFLGVALAAPLELAVDPPAPQRVLRGEVAVHVVDLRPAAQRSAQGDVIAQVGGQPVVLADSLLEPVARLGEAAVRAEGGWAGAGGSILRLGLQSAWCEVARGVTCAVSVVAQFDRSEPFATLEVEAAGDAPVPTILAVALSRAFSNLRQPLQLDPDFAAALALRREAPPPRSVAALRWTDARGVPRVAEWVQGESSAWCVRDAEGARWLEPDSLQDAVLERGQIRAAPGATWVLARDVDGGVLGGAFAGRLPEGVAVDTGTRHRLLDASLPFLYVSSGSRDACPVEGLAGADGDRLLLLDRQGRSLDAVHFQFDRLAAPRYSVWATRAGDLDSTLTTREFLELTDRDALRQRYREAQRRIVDQERVGIVVASVGGGLAATSLGLLLAGVGLGTPEPGSSGGDVISAHTPLSLALPLAIVSVPMLASGVGARVTADRQRAELESGDLQLLRDPRAVWRAVQEHNEAR